MDPSKLQEKGLSGTDVMNAVNSQNLILPMGTEKIGGREYDIALNSSPKKVDELNDLPVRVVNGAMVYLRDVAYVHDGASFQTNIARRDGERGALLVVYKNGKTSTLDIVKRLREALPKVAATLPAGMELTPVNDQSIFVRNAISGVLREALIAACLTAALILLFLGSWRSTIVVATSIPLSILTSLMILSMIGETINIMTLGGLALAVGILVDDATVEIENINRLMPEGMPLRETILTGAQQIAAPAFVATPEYLYRVRADLLLKGYSRLPVPSLGRSGRFRHDGVLLPLPDARAHHGSVLLPRRAPQASGRIGRPRSARTVPALSHPFRRRLRTHARRLCEHASLVSRSPSAFRWRVPRLLFAYFGD